MISFNAEINDFHIGNFQILLLKKLVNQCN